MPSLLEVRDSKLAVQKEQFFEDEIHAIDRDVLALPECVVESLDVDPASVLRPAFDSLFQAGGFLRSSNYDERGNWVLRALR